MTRITQRRSCIFHLAFQRPTAVLAIAVVLALAGVGTHSAQAQTFTVLHQFTGPDGTTPFAGLTMDRAGNLYGTAYLGGQGFGFCNLGCGTVYKLTHTPSGWVFTTLYFFTGDDGANPRARVVFGPDGALYGTTTQGGVNGRGVVFQLRPPANFCRAVQCLWTETILHTFAIGGNDGAYPGKGDLVFDSAGNIYGTTEDGGGFFGGTIYQLVRSNGSWTENVLHSFRGGSSDGSQPLAGLVMDSQGNFYGTTQSGGSTQGGTVYQLSHSGSGWTETVIHSFDGNTEGSIPYGGVIFDAAGNLYGATSNGGPGFAGGVYELTPSGGGWTSNVLYTFTAYIGSRASLTFGPKGELYGTLNLGDVDVFQLTPSGGQWTLTGINGRTNDMPEGNVIFDAQGNLYTTGSQGGPNQDGLVLQITP